MKRKLTAEEERQISEYMEICARMCANPITTKSDVRQVFDEHVFQGPIAWCAVEGYFLNLKIRWLAREDGEYWFFAGNEQIISVDLTRVVHLIEDRDGSVLIVFSSTHTIQTILPGKDCLKPEQVKGL